MGQLAVEIGLDRVGDADAADQQGGQPDQGEEGGQIVEQTVEAGGGLGQVAPAPWRIGEGMGQIGFQSGGIAAGGQGQPCPQRIRLPGWISPVSLTA